MGIIATLLLGGAIVALIVGGFLKYKGGRLSKAPFVPTGQAGNAANADPKGTISTQGTVECPQPLISPVTGTPCLYYKLEVIGHWKAGDTSKKKTYVEDKQGAAFSLNDGSGSVPVDVREGGDLDLQKTFDETKKEGFFADIKSAVGKGEPMMFGNYAFANPPMSKANKFHCVERIMPVPPSAFVLGKLQEGVIGRAGMFGMILSPKTRDDLLGSSAKNAKLAFIGGAAAGGLGAVLAVVSMVVG
ncbi:MAG: GIDE domain-containing protein [Sandaracinaceae bacterium]